MASGPAFFLSAHAQEPVEGWEVLDQYCVKCHNTEDWAGQIAFDSLDRSDIHVDAEVWEKAILKLRSGLMPPSGQERPERAVLENVAAWLETGLDDVSAIDPGSRILTRMNRTEYTNAVRDLLAFDATNAVKSLPEETTSESFDNIAETLNTTPTLLDGYLSTAIEISRQAVGNLDIGATDIHYYRGGNGTQQNHIDGMAPGTRGGMQIEHNFPVDAEYIIRVSANIQEMGWKNDTGRMFWCNGPSVDVAFNNKRIEVDNFRSFRVRVPAGVQRINVALVDDHNCAGATELYLGEAMQSLSGAIQEIEVQGPFNATSSGDTPSRRQIFSCQPANANEETGCAREILSKLATRAYRQQVNADDALVDDLMNLYTMGREEVDGNFELGVQYALSRLLVDPRFIYRFEREPENLAKGDIYELSDLELATRLSFFMWSSIPDDELLQVALQGKLKEPGVLEAQVTRMLNDSRSQALVDNFVGQWLQLRALEEASPRGVQFDDDLRRAMRAETELVFSSMIRENRNMLELLNADYTYLNERLAQHYGIDGVQGSYMRRVELADDSPRRGLLGQGSILTVTSIPNRTSPVVRGVWIVENLLGAPIPEPPPGVETNLDGGGNNALADTLRGRLEQHRADPVCSSCHGVMDPIGLALENFDHSGRWREQDNGMAIDATTIMVDGTNLDGAVALREALQSRPDAFMRSLAGKLMIYGLGRELSYADEPTVRAVVRESAERGYTFASIVQGIVSSDTFRKRSATGETSTDLVASNTIENDSAGGIGQ